MLLCQQYLFNFCYLTMKYHLIDRQEILQSMNLKKSFHDKIQIDYFFPKCSNDEG